MNKILRTSCCLALLGIFTPAMASDRIFIYPAQGQSDQQLSEDRYHCHQWAVGATGFDPITVKDSKPEYVRVPIPDNPKQGAAGKGMLGGAIAGAAIGEIDANNPARGAAIGAIVGGLLGSIVEHDGEKQSRQQAEQQAEQQAKEMYQDRRELAIGRANYRRAIGACLEGRGYKVN